MDRFVSHLNIDTLLLKIPFEMTSQQSFKVDQLAHFLINLRPQPDAAQRLIIFVSSVKLDCPGVYEQYYEEEEHY